MLEQDWCVALWRAAATGLIESALEMNHTGRELELMLAGKKPLAMFYCTVANGRAYEEIPEEEFDAYVTSGRFAKGEHEFSPSPGVLVRYVFYALRSEEWRIPAVKLVIQQMQRMGRSDEGIDRITGALLGYTEQEIDDYVKLSPHYAVSKA